MHYLLSQSLSEVRQTPAGNTSGPAWSCHVARRHNRFLLVTSNLSCEGVNASKKIPLNPETELISFLRGLLITSHQKTDHLFYSKKRTISKRHHLSPPLPAVSNRRCVPKLCTHNFPSCRFSFKNPTTKSTKMRLSWYRTNTRATTAREPSHLWSLALRNQLICAQGFTQRSHNFHPNNKGLKTNVS